jgi:hypothetical protein
MKKVIPVYVKKLGIKLFYGEVDQTNWLFYLKYLAAEQAKNKQDINPSRENASVPAIQKLARQIEKEAGINHRKALDESARAFGFRHWDHARTTFSNRQFIANKRELVCVEEKNIHFCCGFDADYEDCPKIACEFDGECQFTQAESEVTCKKCLLWIKEEHIKK